MELYLHVHYKMLIPLYTVMFQEFVRTLKEAGVDEITSPQGVQSENAPEKHEPYSALGRFRPKKKKKEGV
jgi:pyruvate formate-lyase activating enzyme-like uncharacterized protein